MPHKLAKRAPTRLVLPANLSNLFISHLLTLTGNQKCGVLPKKGPQGCDAEDPMPKKVFFARPKGWEINRLDKIAGRTKRVGARFANLRGIYQQDSLYYSLLKRQSGILSNLAFNLVWP